MTKSTCTQSVVEQSRPCSYEEHVDCDVLENRGFMSRPCNLEAPLIAERNPKGAECGH